MIEEREVEKEAEKEVKEALEKETLLYLSNCSICLDNANPKGETLIITKCSHVFHLACICQLEAPSCPNCRALIDKKDFIDIVCTGDRLKPISREEEEDMKEDEDINRHMEKRNLAELSFLRTCVSESWDKISELIKELDDYSVVERSLLRENHRLKNDVYMLKSRLGTASSRGERDN